MNWLYFLNFLLNPQRPSNSEPKRSMGKFLRNLEERRTISGTTLRNLQIRSGQKLKKIAQKAIMPTDGKLDFE
jgi:hypothetical protein